MKKGKKLKKSKRKGLKIKTVHHSFAIFYYGIMIVMAISLLLYFIYIKSIIDPWLDYMSNSTLP